MLYALKFFSLVLFEVLKITGPALLVVFIVLALACYGFQMVRLFFKF
jgi:hypothetical protein